MGVYFVFIKKSFFQKYEYRANTLVNIVGTIISLFVMVNVWSSLYGGNVEMNGITMRDMILYVIVSSLVSALIYSNIGNLIGGKIADGSISIDLIKPVHFKWYIFSNQLGENIYKFIFCSLPVVILFLCVLELDYVPSYIQILLFSISLFNGILIMFSIHFILGLTTFWLKTSFYVDWFMRAFFELFAGTFIPLWFYPKFMYKLTVLLPFHLVSFRPISILLGKQSSYEAVQTVILQIFWIIVLLIIEKVIWKFVRDKIDIQGG